MAQIHIPDNPLERKQLEQPSHQQTQQYRADPRREVKRRLGVTDPIILLAMIVAITLIIVAASRWTARLTPSIHIILSHSRKNRSLHTKAHYLIHFRSTPHTLILPAIFPYLITGMLTVSGGAWNASIVSEYVQFNNHTVSTIGLGASIASAAVFGNFTVLLAGTLLMAVFVVTLNRLVWKRLYALAERRYTLA